MTYIDQPIAANVGGRSLSFEKVFETFHATNITCVECLGSHRPQFHKESNAAD